VPASKRAVDPFDFSSSFLRNLCNLRITLT
jgi:hypothetical protein